MAEQTKKFKTEVQQLLDLMIHSLYSNKDIFLRELIANAADAIDKARFAALTDQDLSADWEIRISSDKEKNILSICDNGIGMTREEVIRDIGTIAKSGTKAFLSALEKQEINDSPELIGQFGVGFYSSFMVAKKVILVTKKADSEEAATRWESSGKSSYKIVDDERTEPGTEIQILLKPDAKIYLEEWKIREIVKKYSDFIEHPVKMAVTRKQDDESEKTEDEILNSQKAIWLREPKDISEEEHQNFYSHLAHFNDQPLKHIHYTAEGTTEFKALLYLPAKAPFDLFIPEQRHQGLHLYIRRIFICDDCPNLLPDYLRFVKGVVDSSDLPLNISREVLQENAEVLKIQKNLVRKILAELKKLKDNENEQYLSFYKEFAKVIKEGLHTDFSNREKLQELIYFETMKSDAGSLISLEQYVKEMPPEQQEIYYLTGESREMLENSPHLEILKAKGWDVLFMIDPIDEWVVQSLTEYQGKKLKAVGKGEIELDEASKKAAEAKTEKAAKEHKNLIEFLKQELAEEVKDVRFSKRLTDSACCLVGEDHDLSPNMERIFKAMNQEMPANKRILELNPDHSLVAAFQQLFDKNKKHQQLPNFARLLYDQALLTEGSPISDPLEFTRKVADLMVIGLQQEAGK